MQLLIFDVGGVMVDGFNVMPAVAKHLELDLDELRNWLRTSDFNACQAGQMSVEDFWSGFSKNSGKRVSEDLLAKFFDPTRREEMYSLVEELKRHYRVVAGTNTMDSHFDIHEQRGDYAVFHATYASNKINAVKPSPDFYRIILEAEGVQPNDAVFIDDFETNVESARSIGINAIHFRTVDQVKDDLERLLGLTLPRAIEQVRSAG